MARAEAEHIQKYLAMTVDQLYSALWIEHQVGFRDEQRLESLSNVVARGKELFQSFEAKLRKAICEDWNYCEKMKKEQFKDATTLATAIADLISGLFLGVSPFTIAAILTKIGLDRFCECAG